jgi:hypothetical protein
MKRLVVSAVLACAIFGGTAAAAFANSNFHGYVLNVTGNPVSGAYVQLFQLTAIGGSWVEVGHCYSGSGGYYDCGSHLGNHYYYAKAAKATNCSMAYGYYPDNGGTPYPGTLVYDNLTVVWGIVLAHATRIC